MSVTFPDNYGYTIHTPSAVHPLVLCLHFFKSFFAPSVYTRCTKINYKIVPVTSFNKYLHYGTRGNE